MVRVVVAVDEHSDELSRVVSFINDHSDLDVRLVVVEKYRDPRGELIFSSTIPIVSAEATAAPRSSGTRGKRAPREEFVAVLDAYNALEDRPLELLGRARNYRLLRPENWPAGVHYEFQDPGRDVNPELHLEKPDVAELAPILKAFAAELGSEFPEATCQFDPRWFGGKGRLRVVHEQQASPETIAKNMVRLIEATKEGIEAALRGLN